MSVHPNRNAETRTATARKRIGGRARGRLDFDISQVPDNMAVTWIRERIRNNDAIDTENLMRAAHEGGYRPLTTDDIPSFQRPEIAGIPTYGDNLIRVGGSILMGRPKELEAEDREDIEQISLQAEQSVARVSNDPNAQMDGDLYREMPGRATSRTPSGRVLRAPAGKFAE